MGKTKKQEVPTAESIWEILRETAQLQKEFDLQLKKNERDRIRAEAKSDRERAKAEAKADKERAKAEAFEKAIRARRGHAKAPAHCNYCHHITGIIASWYRYRHIRGTNIYNQVRQCRR